MALGDLLVAKVMKQTVLNCKVKKSGPVKTVKPDL